VIAFLWSCIVVAGFMISGFLLRDMEFRLSAITFFATCAWFAFPKIPMWLIRQAGRLLHAQRKTA